MRGWRGTSGTTIRRYKVTSRSGAAVWRQGYRPRVAACSAAEAAMLVQLLAGFKLLSALENAQGLDFGEWLPRAVQSGMVIGAA